MKDLWLSWSRRRYSRPFGDAVIRVALRSPYALPEPHRAVFARASVLLSMYGLFLNLAPVEFATVTGIYLASLFLAFEKSTTYFFRHVPSFGVLLGGTFIAREQRLSTFRSDLCAR